MEGQFNHNSMSFGDPKGAFPGLQQGPPGGQNYGTDLLQLLRSGAGAEAGPAGMPMGGSPYGGPNGPDWPLHQGGQSSPWQHEPNTSLSTQQQNGQQRPPIDGLRQPGGPTNGWDSFHATQGHTAPDLHQANSSAFATAAVPGLTGFASIWGAGASPSRPAPPNGARSDPWRDATTPNSRPQPSPEQWRQALWQQQGNNNTPHRVDHEPQGLQHQPTREHPLHAPFHAPDQIRSLFAAGEQQHLQQQHRILEDQEREQARFAASLLDEDDTAAAQRGLGLNLGSNHAFNQAKNMGYAKAGTGFPVNGHMLQDPTSSSSNNNNNNRAQQQLMAQLAGLNLHRPGPRAGLGMPPPPGFHLSQLKQLQLEQQQKQQQQQQQKLIEATLQQLQSAQQLLAAGQAGAVGQMTDLQRTLAQAAQQQQQQAGQHHAAQHAQQQGQQQSPTPPGHPSQNGLSQLLGMLQAKPGPSRSLQDLQQRRPWDVSAMNQRLEALVRQLSVSDVEAHTLQDAFQGVAALLKQEFPTGQAHLYGSAANGLCISQTNDIDMCLDLGPAFDSPAAKAHAITQLGAALERARVDNLVVLAKARVPVCKFVWPRTGTSVDVTINNSLPLENTRLLAVYARLDSRLRDLVVLVKHWAKTRGVNDTYRGTLSSYAYVLLCISLLQQRSPPILPSLQQLPRQTKYVSGWDCSFCQDMELARSSVQPNTESLAELLDAFFTYFGTQHDYNTKVVSIRMGGMLSKRQKDWVRRQDRDRHLVCIEDPFELSHDLGRCVDWQSVRTLRGEFERAARVLASEREPLPILLQPWSEGEPGPEQGGGLGGGVQGHQL